MHYVGNFRVFLHTKFHFSFEHPSRPLFDMLLMMFCQCLYVCVLYIYTHDNHCSLNTHTHTHTHAHTHTHTYTGKGSNSGADQDYAGYGTWHFATILIIAAVVAIACYFCVIRRRRRVSEWVWYVEWYRQCCVDIGCVLPGTRVF